MDRFNFQIAMDRYMISAIGIGAFSAFGFVVWTIFSSETMRRRLNRTLFKVGYFLYANTKVGKWLNNRNIRKAAMKYGDQSHTEIRAFEFGDVKIWPIPFLFDNYAYVIVDNRTNDAVVVDAGDGAAVSRFLHEQSITPKAILTTHRHWDHAGGNQALKKQYSIPIYGSTIDKPNGFTIPVIHEQPIEIGSSMEFVPYYTPGHTRGHVIYLLKGRSVEAEMDFLFTGDLMFLGGCGKIFEGTPSEMLDSLDSICSLSDSTLIWPGHEYAVGNLIFNCNVDPQNSAIQEKLTWARERRSERSPTCPSTLAEEKRYNLFLRTHDPSLLKQLGVIPRVEESTPSSSSSTSNVDESSSQKEPPVEAEPLIDRDTRIAALAKLREKKDRMS